MCEKYDIDDKTRFLVLYLDAKLDVHAISTIINRSERTIRNWEAKIKEGQNIRVPLKGRGRKKLIAEETENKIIRMVNENLEGASLRKIAARIGISKTTIASILAKKGFKYKGFDQSIAYEEEEIMIRTDFCKKLLAEENKLIYRAFFSDEMGIELNQAYRTRAWQPPAEKIRKKSSTENVKLNCWGAISAQGATSLEIYKKGMRGEFFRKVIENHKEEMERLYPDGEFYLIQDNHPTHRMNEDWIVHEQKIKLIKLPRRSPDLNIIEKLWLVLKERVAGDAPTNEKELRESLVRNWEILTKPDRLQPFFEGLERRCITCILKIEEEKREGFIKKS